MSDVLGLFEPQLFSKFNDLAASVVEQQYVYLLLMVFVQQSGNELCLHLRTLEVHLRT